MKPNFALVLSNEGAELLQRGGSGWLAVGSVDFAQPDRDQALAALREAALSLAPDGMTTKLVVPASEIRYATVLAPGPTDEARRYQIEAEIEGLTPYSADELAYDWAVEGDHAFVAVTAREILIELESFAVERGFAPLSFVAIPEDGAFPGEPFFGETAHAAGHLPGGGSVRPDVEAIRRVGQARLPDPASDPASGPAAAGISAPAPAAQKPAERSAPPAEARSAADTQQAPSGKPASRAPRAAPDPAGEAPADAAAPAGGKAVVGDLVRRLGTRLRREQAQADTAAAGDGSASKRPKAKPEKGAGAMAAVAAFVPGLKGAADGRGTSAISTALSGRDGRAYARKPDVRPAELQPGVAQPDIAAAQAIQRDAQADTDSLTGTQGDAADDRQAAVIAFSSRRKSAGAESVPPPPAAAGTKGSGASRTTSPGGRLAITRRDGKTPSAGARMRGGLRAVLGATGLLVPVRRMLGRRPDGAPLPPQPDASLSDALKSGSRPAAVGSGSDAAPLSRSGSPRVTETPMSEADALTLFGRRGVEERQPLLSRPVLAVLGAVAVMLVAVAIWAVYLGRGDDPVQTPIASAPTEPGAELGSMADPAAITAPTSVPPLAPDATTDESAEAAAADVTAPVDAGAVDAVPSAEPAEETAIADGEAAAGDTAAELAAPADPDARLEALLQEALSAPAQDGATPPVGEDAVAGDAATADPAPAEAPAVSEPAGTEATDGSGAETVTAAPATDADSAAAEARSGVEALSLPMRLDAPSIPNRQPEALPEPPPANEVLAGVAAPGQSLVDTPSDSADPSVSPAQAGTDGPAIEPDVEITVTAGRPSSVPPVRPASIYTPPPTPEPTPAPAPAEAAPEAAPVPDDTPRADPALADARPQPRSERVRALGEAMRAAEPDVSDEAEDTAPAPAERLDQGQLMPAIVPLVRPASLVVDDGAVQAASPGGMDLAMLRPQRRPTDLVPDAESEAPAEFEDAAPEAVATSLVPNSRPQNFARRVEAQLAAQRARETAPARTATAAAAPAPAATTTAAAAAPRIPSSASVQREATQRRVIRVRDANLIGVFGTSSNRRALVRLRNGRVVRLQVGDSFDGGRVSAIGENELRYQRGGRDRVLRIAG